MYWETIQISIYIATFLLFIYFLFNAYFIVVLKLCFFIYKPFVTNTQKPIVRPLHISTIQKTTIIILNFGELVNIDSDAPAQSKADVLLGTVSQFASAKNVLSRHHVQQE